MPIKLGSTNFGNIYLGSTKIGEAYLGSVKVYGSQPPVLPANTIRCKFTSGYTPTMGTSQTLVDTDRNIWDIYKSGTDWENLFYNNSYLERVIAANTTGVTNMRMMFTGCYYMTSVPLFDTSSVTSMYCMFYGCTRLTATPLFDTHAVTTMLGMFQICTELTSIPLFNTSSVTDMKDMFKSCYKVESGALALYQQASTQATPPSSHDNAFLNCGIDTANGQAELAQIPSSWGGLGA